MRGRRVRKKGIGIYDRRVQLIRPATVTNEYYETGTGEELVFDGYPAHKLEKVNAQDNENSKQHVISLLTVEWDLRFIPQLIRDPETTINNTWKLRDLTDNRVYKVVAPATEIGRGQGILIKTELVE